MSEPHLEITFSMPVGDSAEPMGLDDEQYHGLCAAIEALGGYDVGVQRLPEGSGVIAEHMALDKSPWARQVERQYGIPIAESLWPRCYWLACIADVSEMGSTELPTPEELSQIASYIDFKLTTTYNDSYAAKVRSLALPLVAGHNTLILVKHPQVAPEGWNRRGWGYRRMTWHTGSWPHGYQGREGAPTEPLSLVEILDHTESIVADVSAAWKNWKTTHPDIFPPIEAMIATHEQESSA